MAKPEQPNDETVFGRPVLGKIFREVRCPRCKSWLCDEFIFRGRIKLRCTKCDRMIVMVFRRHKAPDKVEPEIKN